MAAPSWAPTLQQVADYIPGRTLAQDGTGAQLTFSTSTRPTDAEVNRLIVGACDWVTAKTSLALDTSVTEYAGQVAAVYVAAMVERAYPRRADDVSTADSLWKQAMSMRDDLAAANLAVTGLDSNSPGVMPLGNFPIADTFDQASWFNLDPPRWPYTTGAEVW